MIFPFSSHVFSDNCRIEFAIPTSNLPPTRIFMNFPEMGCSQEFSSIFHVVLHFSPFFSTFFPPKNARRVPRAARLPRLHRLLRSLRGAERCGADGLRGTTDGGDGGGKISGADEPW